MRNSILIISLFMLSSCINQSSKQNSTSINEADSNAEKSSNDTIKYNTMKSEDSHSTYVFSNDTLIQKVTLEYLSDNKIRFVLVSKNNIRELSDSVKGIATSKSSGDLEIDEDEEGMAYFAQEYIFDGDYWLSIRIDMDKKDKLRIIVGENYPFKHKEYCPLSSIGILYRTKQ